MSTYNVFAAAVAHNIRRVVWASSETVLGLPFDIPPAFAPIDETIEPRPESSYSLSKLVGETMAAQFARRNPIEFVGLRISNIMEPADYAAVPVLAGRPVDPEVEPVGLRGRPGRRAGRSSRARRRRSRAPQICIVAAADTVMVRPSADLMAEVFPTVPLRRPVEGRDTLLAIDHARACSATSRRIAGRSSSADGPRPPHPRLRMHPGGVHLQPGPERRRTTSTCARVRRSSPRIAGHETEVGGALAVFEAAGVTAVPGFGAWAYASTGTLERRRVPDARRRLPGRGPREPRTSTASTPASTARWSPPASRTPRAICWRRRGGSSARTCRSSSRSTCTAC